MPCGCFGGGARKKGAYKPSEAPPKPPQLPIEEAPVKAVPTSCTAQPVRAENGAPAASSPAGNGPVQQESIVTTPTSTDTTASTVDGSTKSCVARSRAELYAKRREFFRPLYEVSLQSSSGVNQRFVTSRSANTLPSRGKRGGFVDSSGGYFAADGRYVAPATEGIAGEGHVSNMSGEMVTEGIPCGSYLVNGEELTVVDVEGRPPRPLSQPQGIAGQWDDLIDNEEDVHLPQDEYHQKHHQIMNQHPQPGSVPVPPPLPKEIDPKYEEFQAKHHKILYEPSPPHQYKTLDPEVHEKINKGRLSELDKLHSEVRAHYERRQKQGPVDVDSLVEQYTEDRWKKMIEKWESEGLVVEGGIVVVDEYGNAIERKMTARPDGGHEIEKILYQTSDINDGADIIRQRLKQGGENVISLDNVEAVESLGDGEIGVVKRTEEILVETFNEQQPESTVTTIVTPPTPQIDTKPSESSPLAEVPVERLQAMKQELLREFVEETNEDLATNSADAFDYEGSKYFNEEIGTISDLVDTGREERATFVADEQASAGVVEYVVELPDDKSGRNICSVIEQDRQSGESNTELQTITFEEVTADDGYDQGLLLDDTPHPDELLEAVTTVSVPPQTCTPPPSPPRDHQSSSYQEPSLPSGDGAPASHITEVLDGLAQERASTPPPSPPLQVEQ